MDWAPLRFKPLYQERVWGGARLATRYGRVTPVGAPIGESWEIADRPGAMSVVAEGPLRGRTLSELMAADAAGLLGDARPVGGRFPLLVKILDAQADLSLQVHPPAAKAAALGGEPKTELWYFVETAPTASVYAGLKPGITRARFEAAVREGSVAACIHRLPVAAGDVLFLPSGRVHALGAGVLLFEIQENSDTTYRVFDWNRLGLDGQPRALHLRESLESIDFSDVAPDLVRQPWVQEGPTQGRSLVKDAAFSVEARRAPAGCLSTQRLARCRVLGLVSGELLVCGGEGSLRLHPGEFCLLPAALGEVRLEAMGDAEWLSAEPGSGRRAADGRT